MYKRNSAVRYPAHYYRAIRLMDRLTGRKREDLWCRAYMVTLQVEARIDPASQPAPDGFPSWNRYFFAQDQATREQSKRLGRLRYETDELAKQIEERDQLEIQESLIIPFRPRLDADMTETPCKKHRYGEPDQQGYVTCWDCRDTFNMADDNDDDDYARDYIDQADGEDDNDFQFCSNCDGHDACADFGCAIQMGLGHLVNRELP